MTHEDKDLLLKDLCARLSYGVKGLAYIAGEPCNTNTNIIGIINKSIVTEYESPMLDLINLGSEDITIKPYLRPMSSMTEEEYLEYSETREWKYVDNDHYEYFDTIKTFDWLNDHHFDYRGLIEKGLALEASEGMYN